MQLARLQRHQPVLHGRVLQEAPAAVQLPRPQRLDGLQGHLGEVVEVWHLRRHHRHLPGDHHEELRGGAGAHDGRARAEARLFKAVHHLRLPSKALRMDMWT